MTGSLALHGGGEFLPGDETFLRALLRAASEDRASRAAVSELRPTANPGHLRVTIVPVAAAHGRPELAAALGQRTLERIAREEALEVDIGTALIVDASSASDPDLTARLAAADLIYLPGGDPDVMVAILAESLAWRAILSAHEAGAVIAGASAGAMGLANRSWSRSGWLDGLGLVPGLIVVPHFAGFDRRGWEDVVDDLKRARLGQLGLDERTGVISNHGADGEWLVAGEGSVHWFPPAGEPVAAGNGSSIRLRH